MTSCKLRDRLLLPGAEPDAFRMGPIESVAWMVC